MADWPVERNWAANARRVEKPGSWEREKCLQQSHCPGACVCLYTHARANSVCVLLMYLPCFFFQCQFPLCGTIRYQKWKQALNGFNRALDWERGWETKKALVKKREGGKKEREKGGLSGVSQPSCAKDSLRVIWAVPCIPTYWLQPAHTHTHTNTLALSLPLAIPLSRPLAHENKCQPVYTPASRGKRGNASWKRLPTT